MDLDKKTALIQAVLYLEGDPVSEKTLTRLTKLDLKDVKSSLENLCNLHKSDNNGIEPVKLADGWVFMPKMFLWNALKEHYGKKRKDKLSRAAIETLSIIAYSQPLSKAEIENLRGVGADSMLRLLKEKSLIKDVGRKDAPGRPALYGTTREFLKLFQLKSISDLPRLTDKDEQKFALKVDKTE